MLNRFNGNVVPFAIDATATNRTVFGDTVQSDDIDDNLNTDFKKGWEIVGINDNPTKQDFNGLAYTLGNLVSYLYQQGIAEYNATQKYLTNSYIVASNGEIYQSLTGDDTTPNVGNDPLTDTTNWKKLLQAQKLLDLIKTVGGTGSGLDSDLLDGLEASDFLRSDGKAADSDLLDGRDMAVDNVVNTIPSRQSDGAISCTNQCDCFVSFRGSDGYVWREYFVASVVRESTGKYEITFSADMDYSNYLVVGSIGRSENHTTGFGVRTRTDRNVVGKCYIEVWNLEDGSQEALSDTPDAVNILIFSGRV